MRVTPRFGRRAALLIPTGAALSGCGLFDWIGGDNKTPLPGKRESVMTARAALLAPKTPPQIVLPPAQPNADWPQAGGNPSHQMGHLAVAPRLAQAWTASIGAGGGYRRKITAQPVIAHGRVFAMDSDAVVTAFDTARGERFWRLDTQSEVDESTNVGGGIGFDNGVIYAATGRAEVLAIDAGTGHIQWRKPLPAPARSAPTIVEGRLFVNTIEDELVALATSDGHRLWAYRAANAATTVLGQPAPAYADGLVVAGFGSGELASVRASSGVVSWTDSLASASGRTSLADLSALRGRAAVVDGRVYAIGLGSLLVAFDLRSGRRLWEREIAGSESPWIAGDWLFVITVDAQIAAINRLDGQVAWATQLPRWEDPEKAEGAVFWLGPVLAGDRLITVGTNAQALSVSPYTGALLGQQALSGKASVGPVVAGGTVYVVTDDATLLALR